MLRSISGLYSWDAGSTPPKFKQPKMTPDIDNRLLGEKHSLENHIPPPLMSLYSFSHFRSVDQIDQLPNTKSSCKWAYMCVSAINAYAPGAKLEFPVHWRVLVRFRREFRVNTPVPSSNACFSSALFLFSSRNPHSHLQSVFGVIFFKSWKEHLQPGPFSS